MRRTSQAKAESPNKAMRIRREHEAEELGSRLLRRPADLTELLAIGRIEVEGGACRLLVRPEQGEVAQQVLLADSFQKRRIEDLGEDQDRSVLRCRRVPQTGGRKDGRRRDEGDAGLAAQQADDRVGSGCRLLDHRIEAGREKGRRIDEPGLAVDDGIDGLILGIDDERHLVSEAVQDVRTDVAVGRCPLAIELYVKVLVSIFPDGVVLEIAADLALLDGERGFRKSRRGIEGERVLAHRRDEHEGEHDDDGAEDDRRNRNDHPTPETFERFGGMCCPLQSHSFALDAMIGTLSLRGTIDFP